MKKNIPREKKGEEKKPPHEKQKRMYEKITHPSRSARPMGQFSNKI
jgi:hypothetical protein